MTARKRSTTQAQVGVPPSRLVRGVRPTVEHARELLDVARKELAHAGGDITAVRQAAEKGWLAATTAGRHVVACATNERVPASRGLLPRLQQIEQRYDPSLPLSSALNTLQDVLHGACFYRGDRELCRDVAPKLNVVERAIKDADALCGRVRKGK